MKDYKDTLNLPGTGFPMRANLPQKEPEIKKRWDDMGLYKGLMEKGAGKKPFVMHDGPPYANGDMHIGHALNKCLKDFIIKSKNMSGYKAPYIHGWDTHGLPIENQMVKKHGIKRGSVDAVEFRRLCEGFARENVAKQMSQQQRLGVIGDWENSYLTLIPLFEAEQIRIFGEMQRKGYIYKGLKPVYWCPTDETALAEAEIEYADDECDSIYVKFAVTDDKGLFAPVVGNAKVYFVIWTTTTWTLPGNVAICVGPDFEYGLYKCGDNYLVLAVELAETVSKICGIEVELAAKFKGSDFEYIKTAHPFIDRESLVIVGDHVTLESGTGCVHTAPGHGMEDFAVCRNYKELEVIVPVDSKGKLNELAGKYQGLTTAQANVEILKDIKESGALLATQHINHTYPHCWRCKNPVIFRATEQWFCSVDDFKDEALKAIKDVRWIPGWGEARIENMVKDRADWCISRQRKWGVPIPIFYCEDCGEPIINETTIARIADAFEKEGSNAWYSHTAEELIGDMAVCPKCGCKALKAEQDIMDVWFDSGSSYAYVLDHFADHSFPADVYLEGNDQYRGWFQSSLLTSVATRGVAPYKTVITHGMVVDGEGKKMSKSLGNGVDPLQVCNTYGADVLRLWASSVEYTGEVRISPEILKQLSEIYRKIRNTIRILMANLGSPETDFDPNRDMVAPEKLEELDKWALSRLNGLCRRVGVAFENYEFHNIYHDLHNFCTIDMSKLYIDITKDRLYCEKKDAPERRSAQTVMYHVLSALIRLVAPILSYTAEEAWGYISHVEGEDTASVFYNDMPAFNEAFDFPEAEARYNAIFDVRDDVMKALELARAEKRIGKSLEAKITIYGNADNAAIKLFRQYSAEELKALFIVSKVVIEEGDAPASAFADTQSGIAVAVEEASGEKCVRCWMYTEEGVTDSEGQPLCCRCKKGTE